MMYNNSEYENLFNRVSAIKCSDETLNTAKGLYAMKINSKRQLQRIKDVADLIQVLQKRDYVNPQNIDTLAEIAEIFGEFSMRPLFTHYNFNNSNNDGVTNSNDSREFHIIHSPNRQCNVIPQLPTHPKERIYQVIASDIGQKWTNFARALHVPEGYIDDLHTRKSVDRVYEILRFHEERCDSRVWWSSLLDALTDARHNDLRKKVQKIFDTYTC